MFDACPSCGGTRLAAVRLRGGVLTAAFVVSMGMLALMATPLIAIFRGMPWALAAVVFGPALMALGFKVEVAGLFCPRCGWSRRPLTR